MNKLEKIGLILLFGLTLALSFVSSISYIKDDVKNETESYVYSIPTTGTSIGTAKVVPIPLQTQPTITVTSILEALKIVSVLVGIVATILKLLGRRLHIGSKKKPDYVSILGKIKKWLG